MLLSKRANLSKQYAQRTVLQTYISIQHRDACIAGTHTGENITSIGLPATQAERELYTYYTVR